jgi:hypothetical protein
MDTAPVPADEDEDGQPRCSHMDEEDKWQGQKTAEMPLQGHLSRHKVDKQVQELAAGTYNIVPPMADTACRKDDEDSIKAFQLSREKIPRRKYVIVRKGQRN